MLPRTHWQRHVARLDPETDYEEIYRVHDRAASSRGT